MIDASGRCLCGAIEFQAEGVETNYHGCHCGMCRRWCGGSPFFCASVAAVRFTGEEHLGRYVSSEWAERGFCKRCGTTLFYFFKPKELYSMSVGAFDDVGAFELVREIYIDHKPDGYSLAGDHPRLTEQQVLAEHGY